MATGQTALTQVSIFVRTNFLQLSGGSHSGVVNVVNLVKIMINHDRLNPSVMR